MKLTKQGHACVRSQKDDRVIVIDPGVYTSEAGALDGAANSGFLVDGEVFHPGDSFTVPGQRVPTLLTPCDAPWLKAAEMLDYLREIAPDRAYSIHDAYVSEIGMGVVDSFLAVERERAGPDVRVFGAGETEELPA